MLFFLKKLLNCELMVMLVGSLISSGNEEVYHMQGTLYLPYPLLKKIEGK